MVKIILSGEAHIGKKYEIQHKKLLDNCDCLFVESPKNESDDKHRDFLYPIFLIVIRSYFKLAKGIYHPKKTLLDYAKERGIPVYLKEDLTISQIYDLANPILKISLLISVFLCCLTFYLPAFLWLKNTGLDVVLIASDLLFVFTSCIVTLIGYSIGIALIISKPRERLFAEKANEVIREKRHLKPVIVFGQVHLRGLKNNFEKMGYSTESVSDDKYLRNFASQILYLLYDMPWVLVLIVLLNLLWEFG
jgi:hypothetical protein